MKISIKEALRKSYLKRKIDKDKFENFIKILDNFVKSIKEDETEEYNKTLIRDFLKEAFYKDYTINTKGRVDLAIYKNDTPEVIIEVKAPKNKLEMITFECLNKKAFQEALLYYLREKIKYKNFFIRHIVITNAYEWFVFDATEFNKIAINKKIEKLYKDFEINKTLFTSKTDEFYKMLEAVLKDINLKEVKFVRFNLKDKLNESKLKNIYKLLSPTHLLKLYDESDTNSLNKNFYYELLYILGLEEIKENGKKLIKRAKNPLQGSLIENTILKLQTNFNITDEKELFEIALELNITWLNRILFLKLLEAKLINIHNGKYPKFLSFEITSEFDNLETLFFEVLAKKKRKSVVIKEYKNIPYLNSSLFEPTPLEQKYFGISALKDNLKLKTYEKSILKEKELNTLEYLLKFLNAYDFGTNESDEFKHKTIINPSVLGLIFEKLNGYKDGSFFTPSFITTYMARESLKKVIVDKFNEAFNLTATDYEEIKNYSLANFYKKDFLQKANDVINSIKIIDPAVGSGHFLVSVLNELLVIKSELKILKDLNFLEVVNENDELYYFINDELFEYKINSKEAYEIQKNIFKEKLFIIENQLFGVDINPNSVKIARLRLWIELLKDSYYEGDEFVTLPNIDINIKVGNSLISHFNLKNQLLNNNIKEQLKIYKQKVREYKKINEKSLKKEIQNSIVSLKETILNFFIKYSDEYKKVDTLLAKYSADVLPAELKELEDNDLIIWALDTTTKVSGSLFKINKKEKQKLLNEIKKAYSEYLELKSSFKNSFEWRFEFPEVLDEEGEFVGFDIVIGNPPYVSNKDIPKEHKKAYENIYKISDDLYNYFYTKGFEIAKQNGVLAYITSNTFLTINSKINIRQLLQSKRLIKFIPIDNPFEEAAVEPVIVIAKNQEVKDYEFEYIDLRKKEFNPHKFSLIADINIYKNTPNKIFFTPTSLNLKIFNTLISKTKKLIDEFWEFISTSKNIAKYKNELNNYRKTLKPGDITLLGLVTDGGQGLATANNGKYIGVIETSKEAKKVKESRVKKISEFNKKFNTNYDISNLSEFEIRKLFDSLKEEYGRDIFGQGYIYRIVNVSEIADVDSLSEDEKINGIKGDKTFVPYDKGDKDGNKWYYETPFYIDWSRENVEFLKQDKRARFQGYNFYFKEGFSWNNVLNPNSEYIKTKLKNKSINDVASMSLYPIMDIINSKYIVVLLNSYLIFHYLRDFINNTVNLQINDFRQIPIIIPDNKTLKEFEEIFDRAKEIKIKEFSNQISKEKAKKELDNIQKIVDEKVEILYKIKDKQCKIK